MVERVNPFGLDRVVTLRPPASNRRARPQAGRDKALGLESIERRIDRSRHHLAIEAMLDFFQNRAPVRFLPELGSWPNEREQHRLFERSEMRRQILYIVGKITAASRWVNGTDAHLCSAWMGETLGGSRHRPRLEAAPLRLVAVAEGEAARPGGAGDRALSGVRAGDQPVEPALGARGVQLTYNQLASEAPMPLSVGARLGPYEVVGPLGAGGMSACGHAEAEAEASAEAPGGGGAPPAVKEMLAPSPCR